jgi:hypothetical protein
MIASRVKVDTEPLGVDALEIDPSPAHDAVLLAIRPGLASCSSDNPGLDPFVQ